MGLSYGSVMGVLSPPGCHERGGWQSGPRSPKRTVGVGLRERVQEDDPLFRRLFCPLDTPVSRSDILF